jgi:glycosyltransferase involved in cell wall biosynthesis
VTGLRVCLVYDCLFPWTVGGAERWMRGVAEALVRDGYEVTYITRKQWRDGEEPEIPGVRVIAVSGPQDLYGEDGRRRIGPPLRFGWGALRHLLAHGDRYDVVHTASFPYFALLGAAAARRRGGYRLTADWHEVWSRSYWREYLGPLAAAGVLVQRACARVRQRAFCFSHLHAARLRDEGLRGEVTVLRGEWTGSLERPRPAPHESRVVFAGRLIPEKQATAAVEAIARAAERLPGLRGTVFGDGPELGRVRSEIARLGVADAVNAPGFVAEEELQAALRSALCLLLPSSREGYGMVVVEAASLGVPSIVAAAPDNAAVEHIEEGVNGFVAASANPADLAAAIEAVALAGPALRESTAEWFERNATELSLDTSLRRVLESYAAESTRR